MAQIERLEADKKALAEDIRTVYGEASAAGFDTRVMIQLVALRQIDPDARRKDDATLALYMNALGMSHGGR